MSEEAEKVEAEAQEPEVQEAQEAQEAQEPSEPPLITADMVREVLKEVIREEYKKIKVTHKAVEGPKVDNKPEIFRRGIL